jgi:hypothetical protein
MNTAIQKELLLAVDDRIQASPHGLRYLNDLLSLFMDVQA